MWRHSRGILETSLPYTSEMDSVLAILLNWLIRVRT